ncbi:MAG TPA: IS1595 family transposase [Ferruginibacter sp.]|nr:IS1595 family transposase [Ferruginibacter sp.]
MFSNLIELIKSMPDEQTCRDYVAVQRWGIGRVVCPYCQHEKAYVIEGGKRYKCAAKTCLKKFSVTVGTMMEASNIPLVKWLTAIYLVSSHKKGISSYQLGRDLGIAQKNSWFMLHRIREILKPQSIEVLQGIVEVDETYMAKKYRSKYKGLPPDEVERLTEQQHKDKVKSKGAVIGLVQRDGKAIVRAIDSINRDNISEAVNTYVSKENTILMTDESNLYKYSVRGYNRQSVIHSKGEWVNGICHTNTVDGLWSVMKRGIYGIYHQVTAKHLQAYCNEYAFRYNSRGIKDSQRFTLTLSQLEGRLTYKTLISEKESKEIDTRSNYRKNKP